MVGGSRLTLVVPVYNERESLPTLLLQIDAVIPLLGNDLVCVISDDGSNDGSVAFLEQMRGQYPWLRIAKSPMNEGKSRALARALALSEGDIVMMMDGDLQNDAADFLPMLSMLEQHALDAVIGWRNNRQDTGFKHFVSGLYNALLNVLFSMRLHDHNCGIKVIRRACLTHLPLQGEWHRYITVLLHHAGYKVDELEVRHYPRKHGQSRYGVDRYIRFFSDLPGLIRTTRKLRRNNR